MKAIYLEVSANVRYWEDANVNGVDDVEGKLIPMRDEDLWRPTIRLSDGMVMGWPEGTVADVHYKVCDEGEYWLLDENHKRIAKYESAYVPDDFLCVGERGYGDYIILKINERGFIDGWEKPCLQADEWEIMIDGQAAVLEA